MMKKYKYHIIVSTILLIVAIILTIQDRPGTLKISPKAFAIEDTSSITSITFNDGKAEVMLERYGHHWSVNHKFNARPHAVKALLNLLMSFEVSSPVSKSMNQAVLDGFAKKALSVSVASNGSVVKAYQIAENDSLGIGSFMMIAGTHEPYVVRTPGFNGRISKLFPCNPQLWRDKTVFSYRPGDILAIEVDYPANPKASFGYSFLGPNQLQIESLIDHKTIKIKKELARAYLSNFASVSFESQSTKHIYDSLSLEKPYCTIKLKNSANQLNAVKTYRIPDPRKKGEFNLDRMYAVLQNDTFPVVVKYVDFDRIMKEYRDFEAQ